MSKSSIALRIFTYLLVGLTVYMFVNYKNTHKADKAQSTQPVETQLAPMVPKVEPLSGMAGFDTADLTKAQKVQEAVQVATEATAHVPVVSSPIVEDQTEEDRVLLHFNEMSEQEQLLVDQVAGSVVDDFVEVRKVFVGDISIRDKYRVVNPYDEQEYGMGEYEYILNYKGKCEIAEVSVNYQNNGEPRVLGYRRC